MANIPLTYKLDWYDPSQPGGVVTALNNNANTATSNATQYTMQDIINTVSYSGGAIDGSGAQYAVPVFTDTNTITDLPFGTEGFFLQSNGNSANPAFADVGVKAGTQNTGIGSGAATGSGGMYNTVFGYEAGKAVLNTSFNTLIGASAFPNIAGSSQHNVAVGLFAMNAGDDHVKNCVAIGSQALRNISRTADGGDNVAMGYKAGFDITTGISNVFVGMEAGHDCDTANNNVGIGDSALRAGTGAANCVAVGKGSLQANGNGIENTAVGATSLATNTIGEKNVGIGFQAGYGITGDENTAIGDTAAFSSMTGTNNTTIGYFATHSAAGVSNEITLGNSSISTIRAQVTTITALSDERDKTDIVDLDKGLDMVNQLKPRKFTWDHRPEQVVKSVVPREVDEEGNVIVEEAIEYKEITSARKGSKDIGFIAQELQEVDDEWMQLVSSNNPDKLEASYGKLLPVLVKAIQELSAKVTVLENK